MTMATPSRARRFAAAAVLAVIVTGLALAPSGPAGAAESADVTFTARVDDRSLSSVDAGHPLDVHADRPITVVIDVHNRGTTPALVRSVRLDSTVLGIRLFSYSTRIDLALPAGATESRSFEIEPDDVGSQATGLLPAGLTLLGPERVELASTSFTVDVHGSTTSVYGLFGIAVALLTGGLAIVAASRLLRGDQPANRWSRAMPFAIVGIGAGLTLTCSLSVLHVFAATPTLWTLLIVVGGVAGLVFGLATPGPGEVEDDLRVDEVAPAPVGA